MAPDLRQMQQPLGLLRLGYVNPLLEHHGLRWHNGKTETTAESVAEETPLAIVYNNRPHVVMMGTPQDLDDFVLGFSITEELIRTPADLERVEVVRYSQGIELQAIVAAECDEVIKARGRVLTGRTGCGICGSDSVSAVLKQLHAVTASTSVRAEAIHAAMDALPARQLLNIAAGAVHAAAWATLDGEIALVREDVGRHNALDKLIGALLRRETNPSDGFLLVTSRASFEMVQKATVFGAPVLAAISGPTGLAIRVAEQAGLTLVGFTRRERHVVYTHAGRLQ